MYIFLTAPRNAIKWKREDEFSFTENFKFYDQDQQSDQKFRNEELNEELNIYHRGLIAIVQKLDVSSNKKNTLYTHVEKIKRNTPLDLIVKICLEG